MLARSVGNENLNMMIDTFRFSESVLKPVVNLWVYPQKGRL
ncbi:hypothetical protein T1E_1794 [Pseudomonas putida DOT-T1E]|uniref:Uncharacterized protein n=1 Tax=Pseudomonas putida (strain DOT-T1E) TaxID=1196325 RepID=I7BU09_PSEPT|nr:hypothetical protein T1E_1794 [Pseudomonas putida DOT-T1E]